MSLRIARTPPLAAGLLLAATLSAPPARALDLGAPLPARTVAMRNVDGRPVTIAATRGAKGTLVLFTCNHCPWVRAWEERFVRIGNEARTRGIGMIAINSNDPSAYPEDAFDAMQERAKSHGYRFPYAEDATSEVARAFGATHTPEAYLFDAGGRLVYHGTVDDDARHPDQVRQHFLADAVAAVAQGRAVPVAETKALGCGIVLRPAAQE